MFSMEKALVKTGAFLKFVQCAQKNQRNNRK